MARNKSTTTIVVSMGVLLTIGAMLVAAPTAYAEKTCIGACKNRGDVDQSTSTSSTINEGDTTINEGDTTINEGDTTINEGDTTINEGDTTINEGDTTIDNSICKSATVVPPNSCRIA